MNTNPTRSPRRARLAGLALTTLLTTALGACGSGATSTDRLSVVASTDVWGDIASVVGGDDVDVHSIISDPSQDPHSYEADTTTLLAIKDADLVIENGGGYDDFVDTMMDSSGSSATLLDAVDISGRTAPAGGELNEHVWYDLPTAGLMAQAIARSLGDADPAHAAAFSARAAAFDTSLTALERKEATLRRSVAGEAIGITEPVPLYLTDALGLVNRTPAAFSEAVEEGSDVPAAVLQATLDLYTGGEVRALVYNEQTSGPITEQLEKAAQAAGIPVVPVTETLPDGDDYLTWMSDNLDHLATALAS